MSEPAGSIGAFHEFEKSDEGTEQKLDLATVELALSVVSREGNDEAQRRALRTMCRATLAYLGESVPDDKNAIEAIFRPDLAPSSKQFVALCLLRAIAANPNLFVEPALRNRTFLLFDTSLQYIYKGLHLEPRQQTYEKEASLRNYVHVIEQEVEQFLLSLERLVLCPRE
jgi:hypothetical protein